jgi:hypothetical protein
VWTHLAFVATRSSVTLYANGVAVGSHTVRMNLPMASLGDKRAGFRGDLQEVRGTLSCMFCSIFCAIYSISHEGIQTQRCFSLGRHPCVDRPIFLRYRVLVHVSVRVWYLRGQVRYWRCARTASELRRDMHYQLAPSLRPWTLLAYWTMNEGLGQYVALQSCSCAWSHTWLQITLAFTIICTFALMADVGGAPVSLDASVSSLLLTSWAGMLLTSRSSTPGASPMVPPGQFPMRRPRPWPRPMLQTPRYACTMIVIGFVRWSLAVVLDGIARQRSLTSLTLAGLVSAWLCAVGWTHRPRRTVGVAMSCGLT